MGAEGGKLRGIECERIEGFIGDAIRSQARDMGCDIDSHRREGLQGDAPGDAQGRGKAAGEMPAARDVVPVSIFHARGEIRMSGTRNAPELIVVLAPGVRISNYRGKGRAIGMAVRDAGE